PPKAKPRIKSEPMKTPRAARDECELSELWRRNRYEAPMPATPGRHPGLDPGSRFFSTAAQSETLDQVRTDEDAAHNTRRV
ncbi:hypothetical protein, partial [Sphingomonas sp.]|uniref:hypothetical protein n=1 Tax=Sphingomonas sp. TaxID=28214 RepID=UPI0025E91B75